MYKRCIAEMHKICFVTTISGTLKSFVFELAKFLYKCGNFEIHFVCDYDAEFEKILPEYIHYHPIAMERGISVGGFKAVYEMYKLFKREKFDIVQYSTPNASCYASIAARMAKIKVRLYCQWGIAYVGFQGLKRNVFKFIEKMTCRNSTMIEPDSFGNLNFSHKEKLYTAKKSRVIWNGSASGVNFDKFDISQKEAWSKEIREKYSIAQDAKAFIFIGRITRDKGVNELFEASQRLLQKYNDAYLILVGNVEKNDSIKADLYEWSQNNSRVIYTGYTNEVEKYIAASDVYVLPSYREGFGSAVIEAEAMGVPVIVTDIPGPTDAMKRDKTGIVVKKGDSVELYNAMEKLYMFEDIRIEMGNSARNFALNSFEQKKLFEKIKNDRTEIIKKSISI